MGKHKTGIDLYRAVSSMKKDETSTADRGFLKTTTVPPRSGKPDSGNGAVKTQPRNRKDSANKPLDGNIEKETTPGSRAAKLMLLLGREEAAAVMARLNPEEAEEVARQIAATSRVDSVEARELLDEFGDRFSDLEVRRAKGGLDAAREILTAAFGSEKADGIIAASVPESQPRPFAFLNELNFNQLANLLRKENPLTLSLVLAYLHPSQASRLLESMPDEERSAVVLRMARTEKVNRDIVETVENTLREKLRLVGKDDSEEMDGRSALADILRYMDLSDEKRLLEELGESDEDLASQVKEKLYTMDSVLHLREKDLQSLLFDLDERFIATILKGQSPEVRDRINAALSSRRRILVADEGDLMGPLRRSEVDGAVREFLDRIRDGEEKGTFMIVREEEDLIS